MRRLAALITVVFLASGQGSARAESDLLPTGQRITPLAAPGAEFQPLRVELGAFGAQNAGQAVTVARLDDGRALAVLTSGFNLWRGADGKPVPDASSEHVLIYDISKGPPALKQDLHVPNAYGGLAVGGDGRTLYVAGGVDDDVHVFRLSERGAWGEDGAPIRLGHVSGEALVKEPVLVKPLAAGLALCADDSKLAVANYENDSISIIDTRSRRLIGEVDLRPGKSDPRLHGRAGGEFPYWLACKGADKLYVSSLRDREVDVVRLTSLRVETRIKVKGNPNRLLLDRSGARLFVAADNADKVYVIDTERDAVTQSIAAGAPPGYGPNANLPGASPNSLALSPDERTLYVTDGGINAVGVISLARTPHLVGLIPTAWQPNAIVASADGARLYVANGKSPAGPNERNCRPAQKTSALCGKSDQNHGANQYVWQLTHGGLASLPAPDDAVLKRLTAQTGDNNHYRETMSDGDRTLLAALRARIKHVIYVVKENRTYDQILGDLAGADGDPALVQFGEANTPNAHLLARQFVALDAFFDSGEASGDGWNWSTAARTTDVTEKEMPVNYADRGLSYDFEGNIRDVNVSVPIGERPKVLAIGEADPDLLPGPASHAAPDGPEGQEGQGYIWNAALRAGLSVRNYGFFLDLGHYQLPGAAPPERDPFSKRTVVAFPANTYLAPRTDLYYRGFDTKFPDYWRYKEWEREFSTFERKRRLPDLEFVRFMNDHTGSFSAALDGVNTPELQIADNDYALGLLVERVAASPFAKDTLIFAVEDDAQDGPDHVDAHRSVAFVAGPFVKHGAVVSERYTTVNLMRTMEEILGLKPLNLHDANARAMTGVFDLTATKWSFKARPSDLLRATQLPLPSVGEDAGPAPKPKHDSAYWTTRMAGFDFSSEDKLDPRVYNMTLWAGTKGDAPYPTERSGADLRSQKSQTGAR